MDDLEFVHRCIKGDKQLWDEFVDKYSRLIYNYLYGVLKIKGHLTSKDTLEELFQEIFLLLVKDNFKKLKSYKGKNGCSLASWLRQVTIHFAIDYIRRIKPAVSIDANNEEELNLRNILIDDSPGICDILSSEEKLASLEDCISFLGRDDKYFLELHFTKGLEIEILKDYFRVSRAALDMRKTRIMQRLRECFKKKGFVLDF